MSNRVLSIEISNSLTRICEMDYKVKKPKVYKCISVKNPDGTILDGRVQVTEDYVAALKAAMNTNGIHAKKAIFTIASTRVASREVPIPKGVKPNKIENTIRTNASDYFPVDLTNYEVGYYMAGGTTANGQQRVMALAAPKELLGDYYELAKSCGLEVEAFDYGSNSLYQVLKDEESDQVTLVVKIDESSAIVTILRSGEVLLQRNVAYGVEEAIRTMIASKAYEDANDYMSAIERFQGKTCVNRVLRPDDGIYEEATRWEDEDAGNRSIVEARGQITATLEPLITGVERVIDFYEARNAENPIARAYVTGLGGSFSGVSRLFSNCLQRKVNTLSEVSKIGMNKAIRASHPAAYISCLGAVLQPVGLVDHAKLAGPKGSSVNSGFLVTLGSVAVLVIGIGVAGVMILTSTQRINDAKSVRTRLQNRQTELASAQVVYDNYLAAKAQYDKYQYFYDYTESPNDDLVDFLNQLEMILPSSFYTDSFTSDQTGISMTVTVEGKAAAARTIMNIRNMDSIASVTVSGVTEELDDAGNTNVTFSLTATYKDKTADEAEATDATDAATTADTSVQ